MFEIHLKKTYSNGTEKDKGNQFEKDPWFAILDVEEDRMFVAVRINRADDESSNQSAKKRAPERFHGKIVADLNGRNRIQDTYSR